MWQAAIYIGVFYGGALAGYLLKWWGKNKYKEEYSGTIFVDESDEKLLYSLELTDLAETLKYQKEVRFKVEIRD